MNATCDIITDLLPLYHDEVCNKTSKKFIEEHLETCERCQTLLEKMKDNVLDERIKKEREEVLGNHWEIVKHKGLTIGIAIFNAMILIITFIVNLATAGRLDWFFIVLTSVLVFESLVFLPLGAIKNKGLWVLGSFVSSLLLLLFTIDTLYGESSWFLIPASAIIFGTSVLFAPYVLAKLPLTGFISRHKGFVAMALNTLLLYTMLAVIGFQTHSTGGYWRTAFLTASYAITYPWAMFITIRYFKVNGFIKAGLCLFYSGLFTLFTNSMIDMILDGIWYNPLREANLFSADGWNWINYRTVNANINLLILLACFIIGAILISVGLMRKKKVKI